MTRARLPGAADPGRALVFVAVILTFGSAIFWLWDDASPGYDVAHGGFEQTLVIPLALCALPLLSRRHRRALAVVSAIVLLAWSLVTAYFGGLVMFPEVVVLFITTAQCRPAARPTRSELKRAHQPT